MRSIILGLLCCLFTALPTRATTWDEPWHDEVMRVSESFVKVKVTQNEGSTVKAEIIKLLAGAPTPQQIELGGFSKLILTSISSDTDELRLPFRPGQVLYLFIKKSEKTNAYQLPTPTSGWAMLNDGNVAGTYRHSFHRALVPEDIYEKTMQAIFNGIKGQPYDVDFIQRFMKEQLSQSVALLKEKDSPTTKRFFLQHVALESFYHLGKGADLSLLIPFVNTDDYHVQISACRAVGKIDSPASKELLMKFIEGKGTGFAKVMCIWALKRLNARGMIPRLKAYLKVGADEKTGFGGDIMDPRVGTYFPESVKASIEELLNDWKKTGA